MTGIFRFDQEHSARIVDHGKMMPFAPALLLTVVQLSSSEGTGIGQPAPMRLTNDTCQKNLVYPYTYWCHIPWNGYLCNPIAEKNKYPSFAGTFHKPGHYRLWKITRDHWVVPISDSFEWNQYARITDPPDFIKRESGLIYTGFYPTSGPNRGINWSDPLFYHICP